MNTSQGPNRSQGNRHALLAVAVLLCAVFSLVVGLGGLSADAASRLSADADPAGTAQAAVSALSASTDGEKDAGSGDADATADAAEGDVATGETDGAAATTAAADAADATATADSDATARSGGFSYTELDATKAFKFCCQVLVNREWKYVTPTGELVSYPSADSDYFYTRMYNKTWASSGRLFVWGDVLEAAYGPLFGFTTADLEASDSSALGNYLFGVADVSNVGKIWNDLAPWNTAFSTSGTQDYPAAAWAIPLVQDNTGNRGGAAHLYYLPANYESPTHAKPASFYNTNYKMETNDQLKADNTFYTVSVADDAHLVYAEGEDAPAVQYVLAGNDAQVTLRTPAAGSDVSWRFVRGEKDAQPDSVAYNADGTVTYTFKGMDDPIYATPAKAGSTVVTVTFDAATLQDSLVQLGEVAPANQEITSNGVIQGQASVSDVVDLEGSLTLPSLDSGHQVLKVRRVHAGSGANGRCMWYTFAGWQAVSGGKTYTFQAGQTLTSEQLKLLDVNGTGIAFKALWSAQDPDTNRIQSVNFYVNIKFEIADNMSNGTQSAPASDFTDSIFSTRVNGGAGLKGNGSNSGFNDGNRITLLAPPTADSDAYSVDTILRKLVTTPFFPDDSSLYTSDYKGITLDDFPSDSVVLESVRNSSKQLTEDGKVIDKSTITTDNYTVRWYSFKYEKSDGWHIDGVLVRKVGRLTVTKTFAGDPEAVAAGKDGFSIGVSHKDADGNAVSDYNLTLDPAGSAGEGNTGYTSYDAATDTYTWAITTRQGSEYSIEEKNYTAESTGSDLWTTGCWYKVTNSTSATDGWLEFVPTDPVKVTAESYATDTPVAACQTIAFRNVYVRSDVVRLSKVDSVTGNPLSGVSFSLSRRDGDAATPARLYQRKDGSSFYSLVANEEYPTPVEDGRVTTGVDGNVYITLGVDTTGASGTFDLMEDLPIGYRGAAGVRFTVNTSGRLVTAAQVDANGAETGDSSLISLGAYDSARNGYASLTIKNNPYRLTTVTASKDWGDASDSQKLPVTVSLWCNGAKLQDKGDVSYTQVLSADNNWCYTWNDLPLFVDGKVAVYALREDKIGSTDYDASAGDDGYADYLVSRDAIRYSDAAITTRPDDYKKDACWQDDAGTWHYATHALLTIHNRPTMGELAFNKVDDEGNPLAGALFYLYADGFKEGDAPLTSARSDDNGHVTFGALREGTYWVREKSAPQGYELDEATYKVSVSGGKATMTREGDETNAPVTSITNRFSATVSVHKVNSRNQPLAGATFRLWRVGASGDLSLLGTATTDSSGVVVFSGLGTGRYEVCETGAPAGYELPGEDDVAQFVVGEGKILFGRNSGSSWRFYEGITVDKGAIFVTDVPVFDLPTSGGPGLLGYVGGGCALMCGAAWLWLRRQGGGRDA